MNATQSNEITRAEIPPLPKPEGTVTVTLSIDRADKLHAFMQSDGWERAEAARQATIEQCIDSLVACVKFVHQHHANSTRFIASVLCSLYNGERVKVDMSGIGLLDPEWAAHVVNVIRLRAETYREPHVYFKDGGKLFEGIIAKYGLEKSRRRTS